MRENSSWYLIGLLPFCCLFRCHHEWRHEGQHGGLCPCRRSFWCVLLLDQMFRKQCTVRQYTTLIYLINLLGKLVLGLWLDLELHYFSILRRIRKMSALSSANVTDVNLVLKKRTHMRLCLNMLIFTHTLGNWLMTLKVSVRLLVLAAYMPNNFNIQNTSSHYAWRIGYCAQTLCLVKLFKFFCCFCIIFYIYHVLVNEDDYRLVFALKTGIDLMWVLSRILVQLIWCQWLEIAVHWTTWLKLYESNAKPIWK